MTADLRHTLLGLHVLAWTICLVACEEGDILACKEKIREIPLDEVSGTGSSLADLLTRASLTGRVLWHTGDESTFSLSVEYDSNAPDVYIRETTQLTAGCSSTVELRASVGVLFESSDGFLKASGDGLLMEYLANPSSEGVLSVSSDEIIRPNFSGEYISPFAQPPYVEDVLTFSVFYDDMPIFPEAGDISMKPSRGLVMSTGRTPDWSCDDTCTGIDNFVAGVIFFD